MNYINGGVKPGKGIILYISGLICLVSIIIMIVYLVQCINDKWNNVDKVFAFIGWLISALSTLLIPLVGLEIIVI
jgi:uncharacterized protein YoxC